MLDISQDILSHLPERIWYLTRSGRDMYCRRPYTFLFTSSELAEAFARDFGPGDLTAIAVDVRDLLSDEGIDAMRQLAVDRWFLDPRIDPETGEVFGPILRLSATN